MKSVTNNTRKSSVEQDLLPARAGDLLIFTGFFLVSVSIFGLLIWKIMGILGAA